MVRNSNPGRELADGTPLGFIQQVIFDEQQHRKQYGGSNTNHNNNNDEEEDYYNEQDEQDEQHYEQEEERRFPSETTKPTVQQSQRRVETNIVEPIPAAVPALVTPTISVNKMNFNSVDETSTRVGTTYILYTLVFSFIIFIALYSLPYVQKQQPKRTTVQNLYFSLGIGILASIVIYFTQNKIINK
jgi:hypothetical protein